jgi:hypothetical protein
VVPIPRFPALVKTNLPALDSASNKEKLLILPSFEILKVAPPVIVGIVPSSVIKATGLLAAGAP